MVDDLTGNTTMSVEDRLEALAIAQKGQTERADWILEHWPNVVEYLDLQDLTIDAGPLDHWPTPLPAVAQDLYNQLAATTADTPQVRTLQELDLALIEASPARQADVARHQRDQLHDAIATLRADTNPVGVDVRHEHIGRLVQRRDELSDNIETLDALRRLDGWNARPDPQLTAAINQRTNHLAHQAITTHEHWVASAIRQAHNADPSIALDEARRLILDVAGYRERANHTGPEPIGTAPVDGPLMTAHQAIEIRLDATPTTTVSANIGFD